MERGVKGGSEERSEQRRTGREGEKGARREGERGAGRKAVRRQRGKEEMSGEGGGRFSLPTPVMGESGEEMVCPGSPGGLSLAGNTEGLAEEGESGAMGYQQTLMYGRYSKSLGDQIKEEAKRQKVVEKLRKKEHKKRKQELR